MEFAFTAEQEELRATARAFLAERSDSAAVRAAMASELGYDPALWKQLGAELGWTAVTIPEACGGLGLSMVELAALMEVMGEHLLCGPFFASVALAAEALAAAGSEAQQQRWLPGLAAGEVRGTLAWTASGRGVTARRDGAGGWLLRGEARHVLDGHCADLVVVAARSEGPDRVPGEPATPLLFAVPGDARGLARHPLATMDQTRRLAHLELAEVALPGDALLQRSAQGATAAAQGEGEARSGAAVLQGILDRAAIALAAEQLGGAQRCLDLAVAHARERMQFGRPIGSFQAIQHTCADMLVAVESARSAAYYAAALAAAHDQDAAEGLEALGPVASLAKAWCSEAYFRCAADALQIHGGVGFTWEYDVHLHLKRARAGKVLLGEPGRHRERIARAMGLGPEAGAVPVEGSVGAGREGAAGREDAWPA